MVEYVLMYLWVGDYFFVICCFIIEQYGVYFLFFMDCWVNGLLLGDDVVFVCVVCFFID